MIKNWVGNKASVHSILGARNYAKQEREMNDYYATPPEVVEYLLEFCKNDKIVLCSEILEPACGEGYISKVLLRYGYNVISTDLIYRGYGEVKDFFDYKEWRGDIITNPPYKYGLEFLKHGLKIVEKGSKVILFVKLQFLETKARGEFFKEHSPKYVYVSRSRIRCAKNGDFKRATGNAVAYIWAIWERGFNGDTILRWFN